MLMPTKTNKKQINLMQIEYRLNDLHQTKILLFSQYDKFYEQKFHFFYLCSRSLKTIYTEEHNTLKF